MRKVIETMKGLTEFYCGKRVMVTGHTGFKGTWLSIMLEKMGATVCGYSLPLEKSSFFVKVQPKVYRSEEGNVIDAVKVKSVVESFQPEIVIHLASHSSLDGSMKIPEYILKTNFLGVLNVLESVRQVSSVKAVVVVTSDKCYQNREIQEPYTEEAPLGAKDPYSVSKVCQELLSQCYQDTFFENSTRKIGIATGRASNIIGNGDYNISRLMPYLLDCYTHGSLPQIRNSHAIRSWQYVLDVDYGYLLLAKKIYENIEHTKEYNGAYNFGPGEDGFMTVGMVADLLAKNFMTKRYQEIVSQDQIRKEANILKLDSTKAEQVLGWKRRVSMEKALKLISEFAQNEARGESVSMLCRNRVQEYFALDEV